MGKAYIGTSGWNYKHWSQGVFYPKDLKPSEWLKYFVGYFDTVEINNSFYRLPSEAVFQSWRTRVPHHFVFAVKASRFITHIKRLKDPAEPLALFLSRVKYLKERLGPILFHLPPLFRLDLDRLAIFLRALETHAVGPRRRRVIEVRDGTWLVPPVYEQLRKHNVALCFDEWLGRGLDVYVYFNNDMGGHAIGNAKYVQAVLDQRRQR